MGHPNDQITTGERDAINDAVNKAMAPKSTSISSTDLERAVEKRCEKCRDPHGEIGRVWAVLDPMRVKFWLVTGAFVVASAVFSYTMPKISNKLDALEEMGKDMAALKVQVQFLIARDGHTQLNTDPGVRLAQGARAP